MSVRDYLQYECKYFFICSKSSADVGKLLFIYHDSGSRQFMKFLLYFSQIEEYCFLTTKERFFSLENFRITWQITDF